MKTVQRVILADLSIKYRHNPQEGASDEGNWNVLKGILVRATNKTCWWRWIKSSARCRETWWLNCDVSSREVLIIKEP